MAWQQCTMLITAAQYEPLSSLLDNNGALSISLTDAASQPIYEPDPEQSPVWEKAKLIALFPEDFYFGNLIAQLQLAEIPYTIERLEDQAWERVCMDQFQPMQFGEKLWICPSWHHVAIPNAVVVDLDPGLAFGTGAHPTTKLCLTWLATHDLKHKIIIDYGCGSGILAIAAAKLGASRVYAVDIDPQAREATYNNALRNHLDINHQLIINTPEKLENINPNADVIIANILANPLITLAPILINHLKKGGYLVLSGILASQLDAVLAAYANNIVFTAPAMTEAEQTEWVCVAGIK